MRLLGEKCEQCDTKVINDDLQTLGVCGNCGAQYKLQAYTEMSDGKFEVEYNFIGFGCIEGSVFDTCYNTCPAPYMFCKDHSSEEAEKRIKQNIKNAEHNLEKIKDKLDRILESRKQWLVVELGGVK